MKKFALLFGLVFFSVAAYTNRFAIFFFLYHHYFHAPPKIEFVARSEGDIRIFYAKSTFLDSRISQIAQRVAHDLSQAESRIGVRLDGVLTVYLYNDWEEKGANVQDIRIAESERDHTIHCIVNARYDGLKEAPEYDLLLRQRYGNPAQPELLTYARAALSGNWNGKTLEQWSQFLLARGLLPNFPGFLSSPEGISEFILYPWNAIFLKFVNEQFGWNAMIETYRTGAPPENFENAWHNYLSKIPSGTVKPLPFHAEFQKGVSYAYSNGYRGGYATAGSLRSLEELKKLGVNWVAAIPYGFMRGNDNPEVHFAGHDIFGESDESMIALVDSAHDLGMKVMMKPQIWIRHDSWPGNIAFPNEAQWDLFMNNYENWIVHYAILSEIAHADLLCIGTELVQATLKNPERWRTLIAKVRKIYHGPLVYAANYGKEFEGVQFWDALDYMGLDNYYPVRASTSDGVDAIKSGFLQQKEKLKAISSKYGKSILFTEIGYMANNSAGMGPAEASDENYNEQMQAVCYRSALETYWNESWFAGMYWWKWFSDASDRGRNADRHSPHGRAAEIVLKEWYKRSH